MLELACGDGEGRGGGRWCKVDKDEGENITQGLG